MSANPGWYPDTDVQGGERYWDGQVWTDHRRWNEPRPAAGTPAGWYDDSQHPGKQRWWDGTKWTDHRQGRPAAPQPEPSGGGVSTWKIVLGTFAGILLAAAALYFFNTSSSSISAADLEDEITSGLADEGFRVATLTCVEPGSAVSAGDRTSCEGETKRGIPLDILVTFNSDGSYIWESQ